MRFQVLTQGKPPRLLEIQTGTYSFGRSKMNSVPLNDDFVSRMHFNIIQYPNKDVVLEDFASKNGTLINGQRVNGVAPLHVHDEIKVGNTVIRILPDVQLLLEELMSLELPKTSAIKKTTSIIIWLMALVAVGLITFVLVFLLMLKIGILVL